MDMYRINGEWKPQWAFEGDPFAVIVFTTESSRAHAARESYGEESSQLASAFLVRVLEESSEADLSSDASFLYVLLSRKPSAGETLAIVDGGALVEFGFGESPAAPEEWASIRLRDLIRNAIAWLTITPNIT